jgi:hypothetical protein
MKGLGGKCNSSLMVPGTVSSYSRMFITPIKMTHCQVPLSMTQENNSELFLGNQSVNVAIDDPSDVTEVVSAVIGDDLLQLFAEQSNLHHKQNVEKWKSSLKSLNGLILPALK